MTLISAPAIQSAKTALDPIAWNIFSQVRTDGLLSSLAMTFGPNDVSINGTGNARSVTFEGATLFQRVQEWVDARRPWRAGHRASWTVDEKSYHVMEEWPRLSFAAPTLGREAGAEVQRLVDLGNLTAAMVEAWRRDQSDLAFAIMTANTATGYDGQPLFSATHTGITGASFSNALLLGSSPFTARADVDAPTTDELFVELEAVMDHFVSVRQHINRLQIVETSPAFLLIVRNDATYAAARAILNAERWKVGLTGSDRTERANPFYRGFRIARDYEASGDFATSYDVIPDPTPGDTNGVLPSGAPSRQPRPLTFIETVQPTGIEFGGLDNIKEQTIDVGISGRLAIGVGFPETAIRVYKSGALAE